MEHSLKNIRSLADKYFEGKTTLAEEATLRDYFRKCADPPADLKPCALMLGHLTDVAKQKSHTEIRLHRKILRPLIVALTGVAAAVMVGLFLFVGRTDAPLEGIICYVNGQKITDPRQANQYALDAIGLINQSLQKPAELLSAKTDKSPTMKRVEEMLNTLSSQQ
jgi:hypothetical protein